MILLFGSLSEAETTATVASLANLASQDVLISSMKSTKDVHFFGANETLGTAPLLKRSF
jgi:hypothetical protein